MSFLRWAFGKRKWIGKNSEVLLFKVPLKRQNVGFLVPLILPAQPQIRGSRPPDQHPCQTALLLGIPRIALNTRVECSHTVPLKQVAQRNEALPRRNLFRSQPSSVASGTNLHNCAALSPCAVAGGPVTTVVCSSFVGLHRARALAANIVVMSFVSASSGTRQTPCWRKGPPGKDTLCNACGARWIVSCFNAFPASHSLFLVEAWFQPGALQI